MKQKDLIIFDLDGVLIDSKENMAEAWNKVQTLADIEIDFDTYFQYIGMPFEDILKKIGINKEHSKIKKIFMSASLEAINRVEFFKNTQETLVNLKRLGKKIAIVTSKDEIRTKAMVVDLPKFDFISCPNSFLRGKPSSDHLLYTVARCNSDLGKSVYIGDMIVDKEAADLAHIDFLHASWGYGKIDGCESITDIKELLTK